MVYLLSSLSETFWKTTRATSWTFNKVLFITPRWFLSFSYDYLPASLNLVIISLPPSIVWLSPCLPQSYDYLPASLNLMIISLPPSILWLSPCLPQSYDYLPASLNLMIISLPPSILLLSPCLPQSYDYLPDSLNLMIISLPPSILWLSPCLPQSLFVPCPSNPPVFCWFPSLSTFLYLCPPPPPPTHSLFLTRNDIHQHYKQNNTVLCTRSPYYFVTIIAPHLSYLHLARTV